MNRLLNVIDASLLSAIVSGLLYILGYYQLLVYFRQFGMNLQVRDPSVNFILAQGFEYFWGLVTCVVMAVLMHELVTRAVTKIRLLALVATRFGRPTIGLVSAACVFGASFLLLLHYVKDDATARADEHVALFADSPRVTVNLEPGGQIGGKLRLFFFGTANAVFLDYGVRRRDAFIPGVVIVPLQRLKSIQPRHR